MTRKSFTTSSNKIPIEFDIDGIIFHAKPQLPVGVLMRFAEMTAKDENAKEGEEDGLKIIDSVKSFFRAALVKSDTERFFELLDSEEHVVDLDLLVEIAGWLAEKTSARPTGETSSSTSSVTESGPVSTDGVSLAPMTFYRPEPTPAGQSA